MVEKARQHLLTLRQSPPILVARALRATALPPVPVDRGVYQQTASVLAQKYLEETAVMASAALAELPAEAVVQPVPPPETTERMAPSQLAERAGKVTAVPEELAALPTAEMARQAQS